MNLMYDLSLLAFRQVLTDRADSVLNFLSDRFSDHGRRLEGALATASERAWRTLEMALAGPSWWNRCRALLLPQEEKVLRRQVERFLESVPAAELPGNPDEFRSRCLAELQAARRAGLVPGAGVSSADLADHARQFARYGDRRNVLDLDRQALDSVAGSLRQAGYTHLSAYVSLRPGGGQPLLEQAVRYFFRREVEEDAELSRGLAFEQMEWNSRAQQEGFDGLHAALSGHGDRLAEMLAGVQAVVVRTQEDVQVVRHTTEQTLEEVSGTREDLRVLRAQLARQAEEMERERREIRELYQSVLKAIGEWHPAPAPAPAPAAVAAPSTVPPSRPAPAAPELTDWQQVRDLLSRCRTLGPAERPEVAQVVGQLQEAARQYERTRRTYLQLREDLEGAPGLPVYPAAPAASGAREGAAPSLLQVEGKLISDIFLPSGGEPPQRPASSASARPGEGGGVLSPLFTDAGQEQLAESPPAPTDSEGSAATGQPAREGRRKLLSPLFDEPPAPQDG